MAKKQQKQKPKNKKEKSKPKEKLDETLEKVVEPEEEPEPEIAQLGEQSVSRPINLTLSSEQNKQQLWQEKPIEKLEESLKDAPVKEDEETAEEIYKPNLLQDEKFYDFETGEEKEERGRELIETRGVVDTGIIESPVLTSPKNTMNIRMMRTAEMQQAPQERQGDEPRLYSTRLSPEQERDRKHSPLGESAEETVRKYK